MALSRGPPEAAPVDGATRDHDSGVAARAGARRGSTELVGAYLEGGLAIPVRATSSTQGGDMGPPARRRTHAHMPAQRARSGAFDRKADPAAAQARAPGYGSAQNG